MTTLPCLPLSVDLFDGRECNVGEGPVWDAEQQRVFWVDMFNPRVLWRDLSGSAVGELATPSHVASVLQGEGSQWFANLVDGVYEFDFEKGRFGLLQRFPVVQDRDSGDPVRMRANDAKVAPDGSIYVGVMPYDTARFPRYGCVHRFAGEGLSTVIPETTLSNGIAWSPDNGTLYFIDSALGRIDAFDYEFSPVLESHRVFTQLDPSWGIPDGMCVDSSGNLWVGLWGGGGILGLDPLGRVIGRIAIPARYSTSCAFVGPKLSQMIVTTARFDQDPATPAGSTFIVDMPVQGLSTHRAAPLS